MVYWTQRWSLHVEESCTTPLPWGCQFRDCSIEEKQFLLYLSLCGLGFLETAVNLCTNSAGKAIFNSILQDYC